MISSVNIDAKWKMAHAGTENNASKDDVECNPIVSVEVRHRAALGVQ